MQYQKYDAYKDSEALWVGQIPSHWDVKKISQCFQHRKEKVSDKDFEPLSVTMQGIVPQLETAAKSDSGDDRKKVCVGDFVINSRSDRKGSSGVSPLDGSVSLISIILKPLVHDKSYIHHLLRSFEFQEEFYRNGKGIVADLWSTKYSEMKNIKVPLPSPEEQKAIAEFIDKKTSQIDTHIDKQERLIALLKERRTAIINKAVTRGLDENVKLKDSGIDWLGEIPEHWEVKKLKYIVKEKLKYGANESAELDNPDYPRYIRITDFSKSGVLKADTFKSLLPNIAKEYLLEEGDVLFARSGGTVGKTFQFKNYTGKACFAGYLIKASPNTQLILSDYLYAYTLSGAYNLWKDSIFTQATIQNIGADKYSTLSFTLPPLDEQKIIVDYLDTENQKIDSTLDTIEKEITALKEYRQSLISNAVTGKIRVI